MPASHPRCLFLQWCLTKASGPEPCFCQAVSGGSERSLGTSWAGPLHFSVKTEVLAKRVPRWVWMVTCLGLSDWEVAVEQQECSTRCSGPGFLSLPPHSCIRLFGPDIASGSDPPLTGNKQRSQTFCHQAMFPASVPGHQGDFSPTRDLGSILAVTLAFRKASFLPSQPLLTA